MTRSLIGCARMYASSPTLSTAWRTLLAWVSRTSGVELDIIEHAYPASLDELWASPAIDEATCARLTTTLLDAHRDPSLAPVLEALLLTPFVAPSSDPLDVFLERQHEAEAAGYPRLA